eukprot:5874891-Prymnesium_polylepis.1
MLQVDPTQRLTAAEALALLPLSDVNELPAPTGTPLAEMLAAPPAAPPAASAANPAKRAAKGKAARAALSAGRICHMLDASNGGTAALADHYHAASASAREAGVAGMAACALLAYKMGEVDTVDPGDLCELDDEASPHPSPGPEPNPSPADSVDESEITRRDERRRDERRTPHATCPHHTPTPHAHAARPHRTPHAPSPRHMPTPRRDCHHRRSPSSSRSSTPS